MASMELFTAVDFVSDAVFTRPAPRLRESKIFATCSLLLTFRVVYTFPA